MEPMTSREKWISIGVGIIILVAGSLYAGARWQRSRINEEISHQEGVANDLNNSATQHNGNATWYTGQIIRQQEELSEKTKALEQATAKSSQADKKLKDLINTNADINQRYDQALVVIQEKDEVINRQTAVMQGKDQIIDNQDKRFKESQAAYNDMENSNKALRKALDTAKSVREIKWSFAGSYDPVNHDPGASLDRHFEMFFVGAEINRTTLSQGTRETRGRIRIGFNL